MRHYLTREAIVETLQILTKESTDQPEDPNNLANLGPAVIVKTCYSVLVWYGVVIPIMLSLFAVDTRWDLQRTEG